MIGHARVALSGVLTRLPSTQLEHNIAVQYNLRNTTNLAPHSPTPLPGTRNHMITPTLTPDHKKNATIPHQKTPTHPSTIHSPKVKRLQERTNSLHSQADTDSRQSQSPPTDVASAYSDLGESETSPRLPKGPPTHADAPHKRNRSPALTPSPPPKLKSRTHSPTLSAAKHPSPSLAPCSPTRLSQTKPQVPCSLDGTRRRQSLAKVDTGLWALDQRQTKYYPGP